MKDVLSVVKEVEILGKKITMYGTIENPLFIATDVAEWIDYSKSNGSYKVSQMLKPIDDDLKGIYNVATLGGTQEKLCVTENGLYDVCMLSRKDGAKELRKEIKKYLKQIRLTGAAIEQGREEEMVNNYLSSLSDGTKLIIIKELQQKNQEYQEFYNDLLNTEGLMDINTAAKELNIGEYKLFEYLRDKKILFYNSDFINMPYERFRKEGKFQVKKVKCRDGKYRDSTLISNKGLDYIRKLLHKDGLILGGTC